MPEKVIVMTAEQYFKKYAEDGIGKGADRWMIKRQLVDAFRKEIFGLVSMRLKTDEIRNLNDIPEGDPEAMRVARNVIHDTTMKWKKLCGMFSLYKETANLIDMKDLKVYDEIEEETDDQGNPGNDTEDAVDSAAEAENEVSEPDAGYSGGSEEGIEEADGDSGDAEPSVEADSAPDGEDSEEIMTSGYIQDADITDVTEGIATAASTREEHE